MSEEGMRAVVWQTLADHQWGNWECSCGQVNPASYEYEDNHLADVISEAIAKYLAEPTKETP